MPKIMENKQKIWVTILEFSKIHKISRDLVNSKIKAKKFSEDDFKKVFFT